MRDLEIGFVEHVETTSEMDLDKNIKYKERILRGLVLKKYRQGLAECKDSKKGVAVYHWNPGSKKFFTMEQLWAWYKVDAIDGAGYIFTLLEGCAYFEKELWFKLGKSTWINHRITLQEHVKYNHNYILKLFRFIIFQYAEIIRKMHNLPKYLPLHLMKGGEYNEADWFVCDK